MYQGWFIPSFPSRTSLSCVRSHVHLRVKADRAVGTTPLRPILDALVIGAAVVPGQTHQNRMAVPGTCLDSTASRELLSI